MAAEERERRWPSLARRGHVRALFSILGTKEAMARGFIRVVRERLLQDPHRRVGRWHGRVDARIVAAVEAEDRYTDRAQLLGRRRTTVIHDGCAEGVR